MTATEEIIKLDKELYESLGVNYDEALLVRVMTKEMLRLQALNPRVFEAALLLLMSTLLAPRSSGGGVDVLAQRKLDTVVTVQRKVSELLTKTQDELLGSLLGDPDFIKDTPKGKVN